MIQDENNIMRSSLEEDNDPCNMMHASVRTESAVLIEAKSADQVQGQMDLDFLTRGVDVGKSKLREQGKGSGDQNSAKKVECQNLERAEPMLKENNAEIDKKFMEDICGMENLIKDQVAKDNWQVEQGIKTAK